MGNNISRPESQQAPRLYPAPNTTAPSLPNQRGSTEPRDEEQPQSPTIRHHHTSSHPTLRPSAPPASPLNLPHFRLPPPAVPLPFPPSIPARTTTFTADPILEGYDADLEDFFLRDRDAGVDIGIRDEYPIFNASRPGDPTSLVRRRRPVRNAISAAAPAPRNWDEGEPQRLGGEEYDADDEGRGGVRGYRRRGTGRERGRSWRRRERDWYERVGRHIPRNLRRDDEDPGFVDWSRGLVRMELGETPPGSEWPWF